MPKGGVHPVEENVQVNSAELGLIPEENLSPNSGVDSQGTGGAQAFPVFKAVPGTGQPDRHDPIALQDKDVQYGLGSTQVM